MNPVAGIVLVVAATLVSCQSVPTPVAQMGAARAAVEQSQSMGAAQLAPAEFARARTHLESATAAFDRKDFTAARRLAEQAEVEAQVAAAKATNQRTSRSLTEVRESVRLLREELARRRD
jgi:hypothetical protein